MNYKMLKTIIVLLVAAIVTNMILLGAYKSQMNAKFNFKIKDIVKNISIPVRGFILKVGDKLKYLIEKSYGTHDEIYLYDINENLEVSNKTFVGKYSFVRPVVHKDVLYLSTLRSTIVVINVTSNVISVKNLSRYNITHIYFVYPFETGVFVFGDYESVPHIVFFNNSNFENPKFIFNFKKLVYYPFKPMYYQYVEDKNVIYIECSIDGMDQNHYARVYTYVFALSKDGKLIGFHRVGDHPYRPIALFKINNIVFACAQSSFNNSVVMLKIDTTTNMIINKYDFNLTYGEHTKFIYDENTKILWKLNFQYFEERDVTDIKIYYSYDCFNFEYGLSYEIPRYVEYWGNTELAQHTIFNKSLYVVVYMGHSIGVMKIENYGDIPSYPEYDWIIWYVDIPLLIIITGVAIFFMMKEVRERRCTHC